MTIETDEKIGEMPTQLLPFSDDSTVIVSRNTPERFVTAFVVRRQGDTLTIERMPNLPVSYRGDFAAAMAGGNANSVTNTGDCKLMILGGSDGEYRGCWSCRTETHFLDLKTRTCSTGPAMLEARSDADMHSEVGKPPLKYLATLETAGVNGKIGQR